MKKIKKIVLVFLLLIILVGGGSVTLAYLFDITDSLTNVFKPYQYEIGDLIITEKISHPYGIDYIIPNSLEVKYQINMGSYYQNRVMSTTSGDIKADENGIFELITNANTDFAIYDIEVGTDVQIKNISELEGFTIETSSQNVTINQQESKLEFLMTYTPNLVNGSNIVLNGIKTLEGRDWQEGDEFTFLLEYQSDTNEWIELSTKTIKYDENTNSFNTWNFDDIIQNYEFKNIGTYKFRIRETQGELGSIDYDNTINKFQITVTDDDMDGYLEISDVLGYQNITVTKEDDKYILDVKFNSKYTQEEIQIEYEDNEDRSTMLDDNIIVKTESYNIKTILDNFAGLDNGYTYKLYDKDDNIVEHDIIRTSDYLVIKVDDDEYKYNLVLLGDISGDGEITPLDYVKTKNHVTKKKIIEGEVYKLAADISNDNKISADDYVTIKNRIMSGGQ